VTPASAQTRCFKAFGARPGRCSFATHATAPPVHPCDSPRAPRANTVGAERDALGGEQLEDVGRDPPDDETTLALLQLGQAELGQLNHALDLIDRGAYGACETCGRDIPNERLLALPLVTRCVACQRAAEAN